MSTAELDRLVADYSKDSSFRASLDSAKDFDQAAEIAHSAGYDVTVEEGKAYLTALRSSAQTELTDKQLDAVAGGKHASGPGNIVNITAGNEGSGASLTNFMSAGF